jgi:hypothetical protein
MRPRKPARLYLARTKDRPANWVIRHGALTIRTGALEHEGDKAGSALGDYMVRAGLAGGLQSDLTPRATPNKPGVIYFVTCDAPDYPIKIGIAFDVGRRLRQMQNAQPYPITLLAEMPGHYLHERVLHGLFKHLHMRGEWFRRDAELIDFIENVKAGQITADAIIDPIGGLYVCHV